MKILLGIGDVIREGDERFIIVDRPFGPDLRKWRLVESNEIGRRILTDEFIARRELKGWEAVEHALRTEVLGNDKEGCETTSRFWDCECPVDRGVTVLDDPAHLDFIHESSEELCEKCGSNVDDQPQSRKAEVILMIINEGRLS